MRRLPALPILLAAWLCAPATHGAYAQDHAAAQPEPQPAPQPVLQTGPQPVLHPLRDVDIEYRVMKTGEKERERVRWHLPGAQHPGLERIDAPSGATTIIDHATHDVMLLQHQSRSVLRLEDAAPDVLDLDAHQSFVQAGQDRILGLDCTEWRWTEAADNGSASACLTADGVLLRRQANGLVTVQAHSVTYRKQDPALFTAPADYEPAMQPENDAP